MPKGMQAIYTRSIGAGGASSFTFSNIPQTYTDLKIFTSIRDGRTDAGYSNVRLNFNGSSSGLFSSTNIAAVVTDAPNGSRFTDLANQDYALYCVGTVATSNSFSNSEIYIPNYYGNTFKNFTVDSVVPNNSTAANANLTLCNSSLFRSNAPISSITFTAINGVFQQYSTFTLYGISR